MLWTCRLLSAPDADRRASRPGGWLWFACEPRSWGRSDGLRPCRRDGSRTVVRKRTTATRRIKPNRAPNQTQSRVESNPFLAPNQTHFWRRIPISGAESNPIARRIKPNRASNQTQSRVESNPIARRIKPISSRLLADLHRGQGRFGASWRRTLRVGRVVGCVVKTHHGLRKTDDDSVPLHLAQHAIGNRSNFLIRQEFGQDRGGAQRGVSFLAEKELNPDMARHAVPRRPDEVPRLTRQSAREGPLNLPTTPRF